MTPDITNLELKEFLNALLAEQKDNDRLFKETAAQFKEIAARFKETGKRFKETDAKFKETDAKFKETDAKFKETGERFKETDARFKETDARFKETDRQFKETGERFKETDARFKETDKQFKETDKKIKSAFDLFTNQWGRLMESLVEGDLIKLLRQRNISVDHASTRIKGRRDGEYYEFDIIAVDTTELVVTEVKTTLRPDDIQKFKEKLEKLKFYLPEYTAYRVYGAIAYLQEHSEAARMAEKDGLLVIKATGSSASIVNAADFKPKVW